MNNRYSDAIKEVYSICPSGETLEIRHPDKESIFIVRDQFVVVINDNYME